MFLILNAISLIYVTSAEFNLNSLNATTKSLDTFNQSKITLNNTWDYKDDDDPIVRQLKQQKFKSQATENGKLLLSTTTAATTIRMKAKKRRKYLTNQNHLKAENNVKQQEPNWNHHHHHQHHQNSNHFHRFLTTIKLNKRNNENNYDYFEFNNKLKTIAAYAKDDAKEMPANETARKKEKSAVAQKTKEIIRQKQGEGEWNGDKEDINKLKYQTKYYVPPANSFSNDWLGQLPQFQLQLYLQQQPTTTTTAAAALLPHEYQHSADYRLLFNAERHTQFYLHTLTAKQNDFVTVSTKQAAAAETATETKTQTKTRTATATIELFQQAAAHNRYQHDYGNNYNEKTDSHNDYDVEKDDDDNDDDEDDDLNRSNEMQMVNFTNPRVLNVITNTIGAAFGVNTRPVAAIQGIQIDEIELYNGLSLRQSKFNPFHPCRILIHGWLGSSKAGIYNTLVPEYLKLQQGAYNVFTVDWGKGAIADYITASFRVKPVGMLVAKFIDFLHQESGIPFENIHVVGFSMGAHVAGIAGKYVQSGRLPVIYGLDPALPLFRYENVKERLDSSDADYVEVIHTSVGSYGYGHPLGHVDFYVNFGYNQPGCFFNECSHFRAFQVYAQSLGNEELAGEECSPELWWDMIKHKRCLKKGGGSLRVGVEGLKTSEMALRRGLYYVLTNAQAPFGMS